MPRISALKYDYKKKDIGRIIKAYMTLNHVRQQDMATALDMTQANFSMMLKKGNIPYIKLVKIIEVLNLEDSQVIQLMRC